MLSISCPARGDCTAGGALRDRAGHQQAFVVSETKGAWGRPIKVPGSGRLNAGGAAFVGSVSCASAGNCATGGSYTDGSRNVQAFVASETKGAWGRAIEVPGSGRLNVAGDASVDSVSCTSPGNCGAGGFYGIPLSPVAPSQQPFVVSERNGSWGRAINVPGLGNAIEANVASVSCTSAGNCGAGGDIEDTSFTTQPFVVSQVHGRWQKAIELRGTVPLNGGVIAGVLQISCPSAGNCSAAGVFTDHANNTQALVATEVGGHWQRAIEVPGTAALNAGGDAQVTWVSCASAGNCAAGGSYQDRSGHQRAFVVSQVNGHWRTARPLVF